CIENPGRPIPALNNPSIPNCRTTTNTPVGNVTLLSFSGTCNATGEVPNITITGNLTGVTDYRAVCSFVNGSSNCTVQGV
ncbi:MAG: prepilin-type cleavage/methylation domain-containing protein, partial [Caldimicrobium sp.]